MRFQFAIMLAVITALPLTGCSLVGYHIDKYMDAGVPERPRVYVDGNGEGRHVVPLAPNQQNKSAPFTEMGGIVDKEIFKSLTSRRMTNDMAIRDENQCPDGEIKVCSVLAGCACEEKRTRTTQ